MLQDNILYSCLEAKGVISTDPLTFIDSHYFFLLYSHHGLDKRKEKTKLLMMMIVRLSASFINMYSKQWAEWAAASGAVKVSPLSWKELLQALLLLLLQLKVVLQM